jgi:inhibitor of KinA sporulation pathway (predicted exonuclease)
MKGALFMLGLPLEGRHHRGIDDARNIAKIAQIILHHLEQGKLPGEEPTLNT